MLILDNNTIWQLKVKIEDSIKILESVHIDGIEILESVHSTLLSFIVNVDRDFHKLAPLKPSGQFCFIASTRSLKAWTLKNPWNLEVELTNLSFNCITHQFAGDDQ